MEQGFDYSQLDELTAEEFGDEYDEALRHFGQTKTRQIAQLPNQSVMSFGRN